jgi:DNA-binding NarL/FixJ family response regulator
MKSVRDHQRFMQLAADIYDAALDSAHWPEVLEKIAHYAGAQACLLVAKNRGGKAGGVCRHYGIEGRDLDLYSQSFCDIDPLAQLPGLELGRIANLSELVAGEAIRESEFYRGWLRPQGFVDAVGARLEMTATSCAYFWLLCADARGPVDADMRRCMEDIVPHIQRAVLVARTVGHRQAEAATLSDVLDGLSAAIFLVDAESRIVRANAAARTFQRSGDLLRTARDRLTLCDGEADQALRDILSATAADEAALDGKGFALPLTCRNGERYVAQVLSLAAAEALPGDASAAVAAVFIRKAEMDAASPVDVIGKAYNLTPTELRVLLAIVDVGGVPEVAQNLGVADTTVKTHLSRLFEKTGTCRQADLVKLVAGFSSPLID